ncbi:hypothetical protein BY458DRAFT_520044 [Sporodiniella umbellata]|nr:hypothetical protein BY458DRAFT_520044 [Sporodiniella umbellata]
MLTTTEDMDLFRLLNYCEKKVKSDMWPLSSATEKKRLATCVRYLSSLQSQRTSAENVERIADCLQAVQEEEMV